MISMIPLARLVASESNPLDRAAPDEALEELKASIVAHGILEPLIVRTREETSGDGRETFEIIAGTRRSVAASLAGLEEVPCIVRDDLGETARLEVQLIENLHRKDLAPLDEARGYDRLIRNHGHSVDGLAEAIGKSRRQIYARLQLLRLGKRSAEALAKGEVETSTALLIASIPTEKLQDKALAEIVKGYGGSPLPYQDAKELVESEYRASLKGVGWDLDDAELLPGAGACTACPHLAANVEGCLVDPGTARRVCLMPTCAEKKRKADVRRRLKEHKENGGEVLQGEAAEKAFDPWGGVAPGFLTRESLIFAKAGGGSQRVGRLLKKAELPAPILAVASPKGELVELFRRKDIHRALRAKGLAPDGSPLPTDEQKAQAKQDAATRRREREEAHAAREAREEAEERARARMLEACDGPEGLAVKRHAVAYVLVDVPEDRALDAESEGALLRLLVEDVCAGEGLQALAGAVKYELEDMGAEEEAEGVATDVIS